MLVLAVLAQPLAMVGEHDDERAVVDRQPPQLVEKPATMASAAAISPS